MANIKAKYSWTDIWGKADNTQVSDWDTIKNKTGIEPSNAKNVKIKKIEIYDGMVNVVGVSFKFWYLVNSNDGKEWEVEGNWIGESKNGYKDTIEIPADDYLINVKGKADWYVNWIQFQFLKKGWSKVYGLNKDKKEGKDFEVGQPVAVVYARINQTQLGIGFYYIDNGNVAFYELVKEIDRLLPIEKEHSNCKKIFEEWEKNFGTDFGKPITIERLGTLKTSLSDLKKSKVQLDKWLGVFSTADYPLAEVDVKEKLRLLQENKDTLDKKAGELEKEWNADFLNEVDNKPLSVESLKELKKRLNDYLDALKPIHEYWEQNFKADFGDKIDVPNLTKVKDKLKTTDETITLLGDKITALETDKKKAEKELNDLGVEWEQDNDIFEPLSVKGLKEIKEKINESKGTIEELKEDKRVLGKDKALLEKQKKDLEERVGQLKEANRILSQDMREIELGQDKYINKLLKLYEQQIENETTEFWLNVLRLDESKDINPKYWGRGEREDGDQPKSYLDKLSGLKIDSEPNNVINALKIVALICATEKAQETSNEYFDPNTKKPIKTLNKNIKKNILKDFENIKNVWEDNADLAPTEANNPLYLEIIKDKETYKNQLENIIKVWK